MAVGKNKGLSKGGKKGVKKKVYVDIYFYLVRKFNGLITLIFLDKRKVLTCIACDVNKIIKKFYVLSYSGLGYLLFIIIPLICSFI